MEAGYLTLGLVLIAAGFLLLVAELFIPSYGLLTVLSLGCLIGGVVCMFLHSRPAGVAALVGVVVALPLVGGLLIFLWPHTPLGKHLVLDVPEEAEEHALPAHRDLEPLKGRIGRALSALRPSGVVDFDGRRVDTLTEGMPVEAGQWVRCIEVRAGKVVVRPVERPDFGGLEQELFS
jgi:membrane-bound ClpP family serine protease